MNALFELNTNFAVLGVPRQTKRMKDEVQRVSKKKKRRDLINKKIRQQTTHEIYSIISFFFVFVLLLHRYISCMFSGVGLILMNRSCYSIMQVRVLRIPVVQYSFLNLRLQYHCQVSRFWYQQSQARYSSLIFYCCFVVPLIYVRKKCIISRGVQEFMRQILNDGNVSD